MNEAPEPGSGFKSVKKVEDLDLSRNDKLTETLLNHHRTDYEGMLDMEKQGFISHLKDLAETEQVPEVRAAAKRFLNEIEEGEQ